MCWLSNLYKKLFCKHFLKSFEFIILAFFFENPKTYLKNDLMIILTNKLKKKLEIASIENRIFFILLFPMPFKHTSVYISDK